jgi:hypothetical protein
MFLMARPVVHYVLWRLLGITEEQPALQIALPIVTAVTLSAALMVFPLAVAERRLSEREK